MFLGRYIPVTNNQKLEELIQQIYENGVHSQAGSKSIEELSLFGEEGVDAMMLALENPPPTSLSSRDLIDSISETFWVLAWDNLNDLIDLMLIRGFIANWKTLVRTAPGVSDQTKNKTDTSSVSRSHTFSRNYSDLPHWHFLSHSY